jgi:hypothetical protein
MTPAVPQSYSSPRCVPRSAERDVLDDLATLGPARSTRSGRGHAPDIVYARDTARWRSRAPPSVRRIAVPLVCARRRHRVYRRAPFRYTAASSVSVERLKSRILRSTYCEPHGVVEPAVITGDLSARRRGARPLLPPDPASLESSSIGGNVAECAGGPRAFKYGTTKRYVLALEAVLPTGEIIHTGSKAVKNVVGTT